MGSGSARLPLLEDLTEGGQTGCENRAGSWTTWSEPCLCGPCGFCQALEESKQCSSGCTSLSKRGLKTKSSILASSMCLKLLLQADWVPPWAVRESLAGSAYPATGTAGFLRLQIDVAALLGTDAPLAEASLSPLVPAFAGAGFHPESCQPSFCGWTSLSPLCRGLKAAQLMCALLGLFPSCVGGPSAAGVCRLRGLNWV